MAAAAVGVSLTALAAATRTRGSRVLRHAAAAGSRSIRSKAAPAAAAPAAGAAMVAQNRPTGARSIALQSTAVADAPPPAVDVTTYEVGQQLHGFTCTRVEYVKEFACTGYLFKHDKTGAEVISMVQPADENKTFSVIFRTPPETSNGIAHVLEHSVLCGSRKYPLKEPFVELVKSSLQTFLNAMTFPDRTCYPVASCNLKDFYNLIDVYMDAVFHPRAVDDPRVLAQEGWHYEIEKKDEPLKFKGVVFNEMKGVYSNPDSAHGRLANQALFPENAYGVDSGGDPEVIPELTFEYFKDFHSKYYHPTNAKFWFYGDDPADARLELLDKYLSEFDRIDVNSKISFQPLFVEPKTVSAEFAVGEDEDISKKAMASVSWVLASEKPDVQTSLALSFLNYLMMGTPASPLYKAMVDSGLGSKVIGGGLYDGLVQPTFSVGLKDVADDDVPKVEALVMEKLTELAESGFEDDAVKAAINTIEFRNREMNTGSFPKGLALMFATNENWNYDLDPFAPLRFEEPLAELKERLASGEKVFEQLIQEYLLKNSHKVVVESRPSKEYAKKVAATEEAKLEAHRATLDEKSIEELIQETVTLKEIQEKPETPEALRTIPRLELSDIPKETPVIPTEVQGSTPAVLLHPLPTSGVVYTDIAFNLASVPEHLLPLVPIFTSCLKQLGTAKGDFVSLTRRIDMNTGGIGASTICMNKRGQDKPEMYLIMRGKSMAPQVSDLTDLIEEVSQMVTFDNKERFVQLLLQAKAGAQSQLISAGHVIASSQLGAQTTQAGWVNAQWSGLTQYSYLSKLLEEVEAGRWGSILDDLKTLQACIFNQASCAVLNLTADAENLDGARGMLESYYSKLPATSTSGPVLLTPTLQRRAEAIVVPTQVNYVGKGANLYAAGYDYHGSSLVVSKFLGATYLWERVRVSGGAYGGFCRFDPRSGDFKYLSYRDPNLGQTLDAYDGAGAYLKDLEIDEDELTKAIIGCMGDVDSYMLPDAKGYQAMLRHLLEEGTEYRQKVRDEILSTTVDDFHKFGAALDTVVKEGGISVVASKEAAEAAKEAYSLDIKSPFAATAAPAPQAQPAAAAAEPAKLQEVEAKAPEQPKAEAKASEACSIL